MLLLAFHNLTRRPLRTALTLCGIAVAVGTLACLLALGAGYRHGLGTELDRMGMQMMLVPLGCPYDAAARVIKGRTLEASLPEDAVRIARRDPAVAIAAPMLMAAVARPDEGRTDMWVGIDRSILPLKPWWRLTGGSQLPGRDGDVLLGAEAAATELRAIGDSLYSPETHRCFRVCGILERTGTSDDSLFFVTLHAAQQMFHQPGRLTAVAIRLRDPSLVGDASARLQATRGAQVVTLAEMMGTFLNLVGGVQTLVVALAAIAVAISALTVLNTMLAAVLERTPELAVMRAVGATRLQSFALLAIEAALLGALGSAAGLALTLVCGRGVELLVRGFLPLAPDHSLLQLGGALALECLAAGVAIGVAAGLYPAWQASRLQPALAMRGGER